MISHKKHTIAFSGLGGSGKTTYIKSITPYLNKNGCGEVIVIAMREHFLWPKIVLFIKKLYKKTNKYNPSFLDLRVQSGNRKNTIFVLARAFFYLCDFWRVYIFSVLNKNNNIVIFDRFFHDFVIELNIDSGKDHGWMLRFLPNATIHFYCNASAPVVFERKKEASIDFIKLQEVNYKKLFLNYNVFVVDSTKGSDVVVNKINNVITDYVLFSERNISFLDFILYIMIHRNSLSYFEDGVFVINKEKLLKHASYNRITWLTARNLLNLSLWADDGHAHKINQIASSSFDIFERTIQYLKKEINNFDNDYILVKNDFLKVDFSGDVDIVTFKKESFDLLLQYYKNKTGARVIKQTFKKFDVYEAEKKPIDVHLGFEFGFISYIEENQVCLSDTKSLSLASVSGHLLAELSMINWADYYKILNHIGYKKDAIKYAKHAGWGREMIYILNKYQNVKERGLKMPFFIPISVLLKFRVSMFLSGKISFLNLYRETIFVIKQVRARNLGLIPFHDEWYHF